MKLEELKGLKVGEIAEIFGTGSLTLILPGRGIPLGLFWGQKDDPFTLGFYLRKQKVENNWILAINPFVNRQILLPVVDGRYIPPRHLENEQVSDLYPRLDREDVDTYNGRQPPSFLEED
jgi:hypothetical protein